MQKFWDCLLKARIDRQFISKYCENAYTHNNYNGIVGHAKMPWKILAIKNIIKDL